MRIAVLAAHPDDAEIWCGGTISKHSRQGDAIEIFGFFQQVPHRTNCARRSAEILGANYISCSDAGPATLDRNYAKAISEFSPDLILTHWGLDSHPDHQRTFEIARRSIIELVRLGGSPPRALFSFTTYRNLGVHATFPAEFYIDVSAEWNNKLQAIRVHDDQFPEEIISDIEPLFKIHGQIISREYAEPFCEVPIFGRLGSQLRSPHLLT